MHGNLERNLSQAINNKLLRNFQRMSF